MFEKTVQNKGDHLNVLPTINKETDQSTKTSTNCQDKDDIELIEYDPDWFSIVKESTNFLSHITVNDDKECTVQYVCGPASAESRLDGQPGSQLDQEVSADRAQGQGQSQARESEKHRDIKTSLKIDASKSVCKHCLQELESCTCLKDNKKCTVCYLNNTFCSIQWLFIKSIIIG